MAWSYTQNFDSLSTGNLSGQDSWVYTAGAQPQVQGTVFETSPYGVSGALNSNVATYRDITAVTADGSICYVSVRVDNVGSVDNVGVRFGSGGTNIATMYFNAPNAADISLRDPNIGTYQNITTGNSANTWYRVGIEFDFTNDRVRGNVNNGTMSAWLSLGAFSQVSRMTLEGNNGDGSTTVGYWDTISGDYSSSTIKTYLGVVTANVKTVLNGTAIASRKTWNGIA